MQLPYESFVAFLEESIERYPFKMACNFFDDQNEIMITYAELAERSKAIAGVIQEYAQVGDRVILIFPCTIDFVIAVFACWYAGVIAVPVYPPQTKELLHHLKKIIEDASPVLCLSTNEICQRFKKMQPIKWLAIDDISASDAKNFKFQHIQSQHIAMLQYTSGSTAEPKGVMLNHQNIIHNLQLNRIDSCVQEDDCGLSWLPLYHNMGFLIGVMQPLYSYIPANIMSPLAFIEHPIRWLKAISHYKATISGAPAFAYELCVKHITLEEKKQLDLSSWKIAFCGGEAINTATLDLFYETFKLCGFDKKAFYVAYGLTEATVYAAGSKRYDVIDELHLDRKALLEKKVVTYPVKNLHTQTLVGYRNNHNNLRIVDPHSLQPCKENEIGEIWINSLGVAHGYWQNDQETKVTFLNHLDNDEGPFLRTGDIGFINNNIVYINGRLKELIIIRGKNYYPQDIEFQINQAHPLLSNALVVAFSINHEDSEKLLIMIELDEVSEIVANTIFTSIQHNISFHYAVNIHAISIVPTKTLKRTSLGKLRRSIIRDEYIKNEIAPLFVWQGKSLAITEKLLMSKNTELIDEELLAKLQIVNVSEKKDLLIDYIKGVFGNLIKTDSDVLPEDKEFFALGMDSLMLVSLKSQLQILFKHHINITTTMIFEYPTINKLAAHIADRLSSPEFQGDLILENDQPNQAFNDIEKLIFNMNEEELLKKVESL